MRIRAIRLREVGRFVEPVEVSGFADGINVLAAPNEAGKSTIFKALSVAFTFPHTSRAEAVRRLLPNRGGAPVIVCEFELGDVSWRLHKQYLSGRTAELRRLDGGEIHRGGDAEDRLSELLAGAGGLVDGMGHLWVEQGRSFALPKFSDEQRRSFASLVQHEIDAATGTGLLLDIVTRVEKDLHELITPGRGQVRVGGRLGRALEAARAAQEAYETARGKAQQAEGRAHELKALAEREAVLTDPAAVAQRNETIEKLTRDLEAARDARGKLAVAEAQLGRREEVLRAAQSALQTYERQLADFANGTERTMQLEALRVELGERIAAAELSQARHDELVGRLQQEQKALQEARIASERAVRRNDVCQRLAELDQRLADVRSREVTIAELRSQFATVRVRAGDVEELREIVNDIRVLERQVEAGTPHVGVRYEAGRSGRFRTAGVILEDGTFHAIANETVIAADGIGEITITPAAATGAARNAGLLAKAQLRRTEVLERLGVGDLAAAEAALAQAADLARQGQELAAAINGLAPNGLAALEKERSRLEATLLALPGEPGNSGDVGHVETAELERRLATLVGQLGDAERQRAEGARSLTAYKEALIRLDSELEGLRQRLEASSAVLPADDDERRRQRQERIEAHDAAQRAVHEAVRDRDAWREAAPEDDKFAEMQAALVGAQRVSELARGQLTETREARRAIEGALQRDVEDGVGADADTKREQAERLARHAAEVALERDALILLRDEIKGLLGDERERMAAPLLQRLQGFATHVFPGVALRLDNAFEVEAVERVEGEEAFTQLSDGTREQISVLVRLALAQCLAEAGEPLPVILDDALAFTDDLRLAAVFAALAQASRQHQIIVLTCHQRNFAPLCDAYGGTALAIKAWRGN
jgi:hypothetical protein